MPNRNIALATPEEIDAALNAIPTEGLTEEEQEYVGFLWAGTVEWVNHHSVYQALPGKERDTIALVYLSWFIEDNGLHPRSSSS